jgi:hypothetical protein
MNTDLSNPLEFRKLPKAERQKLLEQQAKDIAHLYQPGSELLEWTVGDVKDVDEVLEFKSSSDLPPITKSLQGSLKNKNVDRKDYKEYLERKHK